MGGKSELANQVVPTPTQEQLRIAQITQDSATFDGEKIAFQKMVRQVMEAARCNQNTAEIALFDSSNNVEDAILAIIEREDEQERWTESKNRKTKKNDSASAHVEEKENYVERRGQGFRGRGRGRSERPDRTDRQDRFENQNRQDRFESQPRQDGTDRPERAERSERFDRGDRGNRSGPGRGASGGTTRGGRGGRGGSTRPPRRDDRNRDEAADGGFSAPISMWDNNMQNNKEEDASNGDNEELNWSNTPLVFSRREPQTHHQQQPVQSYSSAPKQPEPAKPMSFAAAAAMRKKVEIIQPASQAPGPIEPPQRSYEKECQPSPSVSPQKPYQQSSIFGNSGSSYGKDLSLDGPLHSSDTLNISRGSANDSASHQIGGLTFTNRSHAQQQQSQAYQTENLTNQLKNDLGISISAPSSGANTTSTVANLLSSFQSSSVDAKPQQQQSRFAPTPQASFNNTVEFVTGGDVGGAVTDYQFGFYADSSPTSRENDVDNYKQVANSFLSSANTQTEISPKRLEIDHALSKLNHIDVSPAKSTAPSSTTQPGSYAQASHQTNGHPQQQAQTQQLQQQQQQDPLNKLRQGSGLSYANTSTLSYPPGTTTNKTQAQPHHILTISHPDSTQRQSQTQQQQQQPSQPNTTSTQSQSYQSSQSVAQQQQQQQQQHAQQQAQQQQHHHQQVQQSPAQHQQNQAQQLNQQPLYPQAQNFAAYSNPYMNSYMNMNLYSPVTAGMRTDDAGMAAAFLSYPFMNQMDIASLTAMLPPAMASATASTAQAPPPTMQSHLQHQQHNQQQHRSDQHYDMPKTYSNQNLGAVTMANTANLAQNQQRTTMDNSNSSAVPPPPGFTGPPSNIPAATALFQPNLSSLFQMPGSYAPNLSFPLMFPGSTPQHKLPATMFPQQTLDDSMNINDMRMNTAQKIYGQGQQQDKYGVPNGGSKDRGLNMGGAQPTPPPQLSGNYAPAYGGAGGMQNMGLHKKNPYHWNA